MSYPEEPHNVYFLEIPNLPVRKDLNIYSPGWYEMLAAGRLFPVRYEMKYFKLVSGNYSPNDTIILLVNSGFTVEAISDDHEYFLVTKPKTYGYTSGEGSCVFIRDEAGFYEELWFDIHINTTTGREKHAVYAIKSDIGHI